MRWSVLGVVSLLQMDPKVGDLSGNSLRIQGLLEQARSAGGQVAVSTELAICGYPPRDLLLESDFVTSAMDAALTLPTALPALIGTPLPPDEPRQRPANGVVRVGSSSGTITGHAEGHVVGKKQLLPTYDVFDEARYFEPSNRTGLARSCGGLTLGVTICEDAWQSAGKTPSSYQQDPIEHIAEWGRQGVKIHATVNLSASPFHTQKFQTRLEVARHVAAVLQHPFLLANQVGGNDDLLFDGRSLAVWPSGRAVVAPAWQEGVLMVDLDTPENCQWVASTHPNALCKGEGTLIHLEPSEDGSQLDGSTDDLAYAVITGLSDYCRKSGINGIVLGLSGGIDSAVAACVAVHAVGAENVSGLAMPSRFSSQHSIDDAAHTAHALGLSYAVHPIGGMHDAVEHELASVLANGHAVAGENVQARLRGLTVMAYSNALGRMAVTTGNKSEIAQGYCTLYGDMAGGYAPLADVYKMEVYALAEWFNARASARGATPPVNESTLTKPPSAELAPNQQDDDTLPPYDVLDNMLRAHIEDGHDARGMVALGFDEAAVLDVLQRLERNEHKRWQMPPGPRVSSRAFGQGWRRPLASHHQWRTQEEHR